MDKSKTKVIVLGGGAAGLVAAISAARAGAEVTIIEHKDRVGKKILSTGNGRCNMTNINQGVEHYFGENPDFVRGAFENLDAFHTVQFFNELGILTKNRNGYIYPNSDQASSVLDVLRMEINRLSVNVICKVTINKIVKQGAGFTLTGFGFSYYCDNLIIATGSKAVPSTGSDGSGYNFALKFGHRIVPVVPGLVALKSPQTFFKSIAGVRTDAIVKLYVNSTLERTEKGEIQLTNYGISGIPVMCLSRFAAIALNDKSKVRCVINFLPNFNTSTLTKMLVKRRSEARLKTCEEFMIGLLNKKLTNVILKLANIDLGKKAKYLSDSDLSRLADLICSFEVKINDTNSFDNAQVCAGGVDTNEIDPYTMESKKVKGLYFAGEIIDIDGTCGGYNLQWAWSSGYTAGVNAAIKKVIFNLGERRK
ncbi:hypothetical protein SAMN05216249_101155 [Acetitomaculum ruminis DSM 5522]|uniref:Flavoprotein, HI0933 family n=1 Tax=Acetitomaculum ruminis DSM 5522 TaxID=1120918 RepID=A0A1I0V6K9_9FIRM|nr:NAD(P)/FAD-dependent oxidoreductase [Acetitomaculum ruminis]SFA71176.1 hypothetical protein SAMN05216249_101155 [Acetitomaculum ruminis DSM 5522]